MTEKDKTVKAHGKLSFRDIDHAFVFHPPVSEEQTNLFTYIRDLGHYFAEMALVNVPEGYEQMEAIKKMEEAVMWANAGIARHWPGTENKEPRLKEE